MVLGIAQAVPDVSLQPAVADFSAQDKCLAAELPGLLVLAEEAVSPADVVQRCGLGCLVADGLVQAQRFLSVPERIGVAFLTLGHGSEIVVDLGFAKAVAQSLVQRQARGKQAGALA